ncbi:MAG: adenylosuccinate lyase [Bdellovibrionota bacterium]|nr:adenylosuccinate lyase [Bdellovibrionota bacterium]
MIARYTRPEMGKIWELESRFNQMMRVECAVASSQAELKIIPQKAALKINQKAKVDVDRILEIEKETKHDVIAFVSQLAEKVGPDGRYIHYGMTSSDVLDTALSLMITESENLLKEQFKQIDQLFKQKIRTNKSKLCAGRTHGMHGEPTSFGYKLCGYHAEFRRNVSRVKEAFSENKICKLSGAVGTYSNQPQQLEKKVAKKLSLKAETVATQVVPRDRHATLLNAFAVYASGMERLAVELRHLQRTEGSEVFEGFSKGQKGSSAMPHKKNPITAENVTGLARMMRAYAGTGLENISLWHERDISHSSTERVFFADSFILLHYMNYRIIGLLNSLVVDEVRMKKNMDVSGGVLFSSSLLLMLVKTGLSREEAYKIVQSLSHSLKPGEHLKQACLESSEVNFRLSSKDIGDLFAGKQLKKKLETLVQNYLKSLSKQRLY